MWVIAVIYDESERMLPTAYDLFTKYGAIIQRNGSSLTDAYSLKAMRVAPSSNLGGRKVRVGEFFYQILPKLPGRNKLYRLYN